MSTQLHTFTYIVEDDPDIALISAHGEIDLTTAPALEHEIERSVDRHYPHIVADLSDVTYLDGSGLSVLVRCLKHVGDYGGTLDLVSGSKAVERVLHVTGLDKAMQTYA